MAQSQEALIAWAKSKVATQQAEADELRASYQHAVDRKWKSGTLKKHANLSARRVVFYQKLLKALEAGYIIVPSFPVEVFAVRTEKGGPTTYFTTSTSKWPSRREEVAGTLPSGAGAYQNPVQNVYVGKTAEKSESGQELWYHFGAEAWNEMEFPLNMAKPNIMEATSRAMALKLFDDLGVLPGTRRNVDPIIVGRIRDPRVPHKFAPRMVSFIIAWHLDTATL